MVNKIIISCHKDVTPIEEYVVEDTKQAEKLIEDTKQAEHMFVKRCAYK